jgi:hypothetical protein
MYYCCRCRAVHEKCFVDYISTPTARAFMLGDATGQHRRWACTTCNHQFSAQLSGTSFWFSLCASNIRSWRNLRTVNWIFAIECILTMCIQLLLCAYVAKFILWIFTHASTFSLGGVLEFTIRPNFTDILLGILAYLIIVPPCMLVIYLVHITTHAPKKSERDFDDVDDGDNMPNDNEIDNPDNMPSARDRRKHFRER